MFDWVPGIVMDILSKKALTEATGWVKKEAEKANQAKPAPKAEAGSKKKKRGPKDGSAAASEAAAADREDDRTLSRRWAMVACIIGLLVVNAWLFFENFDTDAHAGRKKKRE